MKRLAAVIVGILLLGGGIFYWWGIQSPAVADAHNRAVKLFNAMATYPGTTALDRANVAMSYPGVRIVVAHNTPQGQVIVLAITGSAHTRHNFDFSFNFGSSSEPTFYATRCFEWTWGMRYGTAPEVPCPPVSIDRSVAPSPDPRTPGDVQRVRRALTGSPTVASVRLALAGSRAIVEARPFGIALAWPGVAWYENGHAAPDCVWAIRDHHGVTVWQPTSREMRTGEFSCTPPRTPSGPALAN